MTELRHALTTKAGTDGMEAAAGTRRTDGDWPVSSNHSASELTAAAATPVNGGTTRLNVAVGVIMTQAGRRRGDDGDGAYVVHRTVPDVVPSGSGHAFPVVDAQTSARA